jgi:hypothetical protein
VIISLASITLVGSVTGWFVSCARYDVKKESLYAFLKDGSVGFECADRLHPGFGIVSFWRTSRATFGKGDDWFRLIASDDFRMLRFRVHLSRPAAISAAVLAAAAWIAWRRRRRAGA